MNDISLGQIENDKNYDFRSKYDEENELYTNNIEKCRYYEVSELKGAFVKHNQGFSIYSHNIRSINGHWDDILDNINTTQPLKFSILAFQEIWSVQRTYEIPGYNKLEYFTRDKDGAPNPNCGGGVGIFVDKKNMIMRYLMLSQHLYPMCMNLFGLKSKLKVDQIKLLARFIVQILHPKLT